MSVLVTAPKHRQESPPLLRPRFDRVAITSVCGDPFDPRTWSSAPRNLALALERMGVTVSGAFPAVGKAEKLLFALRHVAGLYGTPLASRYILAQHVSRSAPSRRRHAEKTARLVARMGVRHVLHTGAFDLPPRDLGVKHYLYCDHTWFLADRYLFEKDSCTARARREFERLERESLHSLAHVFTFGAYVRDNIISHYGLPPERVTAVGSGMGLIEPFFGRKDFTRPSLLFVAKHLFEAKGGKLVVEAFQIAQRRRADLTLTIIGDERSRRHIPDHPNIIFRAHLPWEELQKAYQEASLLAEPMLNDPWGQVFLEALVSRTPVLGLNRNGLPEIIDNGRYGFLVDEPEPEPMAEAILQAVASPERLEKMAVAGQRHVLDNYTWDAVAQKILFIPARVGAHESGDPYVE